LGIGKNTYQPEQIIAKHGGYRVPFVYGNLSFLLLDKIPDEVAHESMIIVSSIGMAIGILFTLHNGENRMRTF